MLGGDYAGAQPGGIGMTARLRGLAAAFVLMMVLTFTTVGMLSGALLIAESYGNTRKTGVDAFNSDVSDWNGKSRAAFSKLSFTLGAAKTPLVANHTEEVFELLQQYDSYPAELSTPRALFFSGTLSGLPEDTIKPPPAAQEKILEVPLSVVGGATSSVRIPLHFIEIRCRYVQRGKMSRQICKDHLFVLRSVCIKVDGKGVPTRHIDGVTGDSVDVGCFIGTDGMYQPRLTHLWSPGVYQEFPRVVDGTVPKEVPVEVRSNSDPALTASIYSKGYYDFGDNPEDKYQAGVALLSVCSLSMCVMCSMCVLQYMWPSAPNNTERMKYFYRRYFRRPHIAMNQWWASNVGGPTVEVPEVSAEEVLLEQQAANDNWAGPQEGGHRLGGPMPPLVQSV